jgi:hypothetical protein
MNDGDDKGHDGPGMLLEIFRRGNHDRRPSLGEANVPASFPRPFFTGWTQRRREAPYVSLHVPFGAALLPFLSTPMDLPLRAAQGREELAMRKSLALLMEKSEGSMRITGKIPIAIVGLVIVAAAGALGLGKLGGFALLKEFYSRNAAHQVTMADVAKDVQVLKGQTNLPKALDDHTELVDIRADGRAVVYVHRLTFEANPSKANEFLAGIRANTLRLACSNKSMSKAINQGVVFRYQYADMVGFNVGSFDIGGKDCAGI